MARDTLARSMHDLGLAAWFGGTLANAVALNAAAGEASDSRDTGAVANEGWDRWTPVNAGAIGLHLVGSVGQLIGNKGRLAAQQGVPTMAGTKTALTAAALGATAYSRSLGRTVSEHGDVPAGVRHHPLNQTPRTSRRPSAGCPRCSGSCRPSPVRSSWSAPTPASSSAPASSDAGCASAWSAEHGPVCRSCRVTMGP